MGLDISVYERLRPTDQHSPDAVHLCIVPEFAKQADGLEGYFIPANSFGFRAGSYSGYNSWRNELARLAGYPSVKHDPGYKPVEDSYAAGAWEAGSGPFWELINFSDCEGTIGPVTSAKLAKDFAEFQDKADEVNDGYFRAKYQEWRHAFEIAAATSGAVAFH